MIDFNSVTLWCILGIVVFFVNYLRLVYVETYKKTFRREDGTVIVQKTKYEGYPALLFKYYLIWGSKAFYIVVPDEESIDKTFKNLEIDNVYETCSLYEKEYNKIQQEQKQGSENDST